MDRLQRKSATRRGTPGGRQDQAGSG